MREGVRKMMEGGRKGGRGAGREGRLACGAPEDKHLAVEEASAMKLTPGGADLRKGGREGGSEGDGQSTSQA